MEDFIFYSDTTVYFGKNQLRHLGEEAACFGQKVLLVYGGGSIKKTGLYDRVMGELEKAGVRVLMPVFALTTVDIPALPPEIQSVFEQPSDRVIFDVGGDDTGAAALGRYAPAFQKNRSDTLSLLVINCMRPLTETREDILDLAERIGKRGRLGTDGLINNTNLADQTEPEMLGWGEGIVSECAREMGTRIVLNTGERRILDQCGLRFPRMEIERRMIPEWMES